MLRSHLKRWLFAFLVNTIFISTMKSYLLIVN
ncbi:hypothetical protein YTCETSXE_CDS0030 [Staphylococcus phage MVC_VPHSA2]|uniref:TreN n=1 Tax=Staphylococcus phage MVC_VPHSA1 TaxID=3088876 RepID=A0ABZ0QZD8_9CAUD|nr:hypothetical protein FBHYGVHD_CDS0103 [Staphylococcus phage MVC_VPHSA1]WPF64986.1 hypothetical protein YTCETSXE_CDS0030 [Staphylococcus phage MVC_VPHSA2]